MITIHKSVKYTVCVLRACIQINDYYTYYVAVTVNKYGFN